jgi:hypothetical protein
VRRDGETIEPVPKLGWFWNRLHYKTRHKINENRSVMKKNILLIVFINYFSINAFAMPVSPDYKAEMELQIFID